MAWELMELEFVGATSSPAVLATFSTPPRTAAATIEEEIEARVCIPLETPILKTDPRLRRPCT